MADPARIIMAGLALQKGVAGDIQRQKNINHARMRSAMQDAGVNIERAFAMQKQAREEEDIATVQQAYGQLAATGRLEQAPQVLAGLELKTHKGHAFAGALLQGNKEKITALRKGELDIDLAEERLEQVVRAGDEQERLERLRPYRNRVLRSALQRMAGGDSYETSFAGIEEMIDNMEGLSEGERAELLAFGGTMAMQYHDFGRALESTRLREAVADEVTNWFARPETPSEKPLSELTKEERGDLAMALLNRFPGNTAEIRAMMEGAGASAAELALKRGKLTLEQQKAFKDRYVKEMEAYFRNKGQVDAERTFYPVIGPTAMHLMQQGVSIAAGGGRAALEQSLQEYKAQLMDLKRRGDASEREVEAFREAYEGLVTNFMSHDLGLKAIEDMMRPDRIEQMRSVYLINNAGGQWVNPMTKEALEVSEYPTWNEEQKQHLDSYIASRAASLALQGGAAAQQISFGIVSPSGNVVQSRIPGMRVAAPFLQGSPDGGSLQNALEMGRQALGTARGETGTGGGQDGADTTPDDVEETGDQTAPAKPQVTPPVEDPFGTGGLLKDVKDTINTSVNMGLWAMSHGKELAGETLGEVADYVSEEWAHIASGAGEFSDVVADRIRGIPPEQVGAGLALNRQYKAGYLTKRDYLTQLQEEAPAYFEAALRRTMGDEIEAKVPQTLKNLGPSLKAGAENQPSMEDVGVRSD
jgi:hypothetical protein